MYISKIKTRFRSDSDAAVLGSLGFATTLWQLSQLTKCRRLHTVLILDIHTAGLFFTGQLLRPAFGKVGGERDILISYVEKTPGSSEAGGCGGCGMPTVNCAHNKSIEPEGNTSVHTPRMACEMSRTWMCVDIVSGRCHNLNAQCLLLCSTVYRRDSTSPTATCLPLPGVTFLE